MAVAAAACGRINFEENRAPGVGPDGGVGAGPDAVQSLILGVQGEQASYLVSLRFDPQSRTASVVGEPLRLDELSGSDIRSVNISGREALAGGGSSIARIDLASWTVAGRYDVSGSLGRVHGKCELPGRRWAIGDSGASAPNSVAEFEPTGEQMQQLGMIYSTTVESGSLSSCSATSSTELYLIEWAAWTDTDGDLVRLRLSEDQWQPEARFDTSAFAVAENGDNHETSIYSFVVHPSGSLYVFPQRRSERRVKSLIECPADFASEADCVERGSLPPDASADVNGPDAIQGATLGEAGAAIYFVTNSCLFRYDLTADTWAEILDLEAEIGELRTDAGAIDQIHQVRDLRAVLQ